MKKRLLFLALTLFLIGVEVLIALYVHDRFIRPFFGDVLVAVLLCAAVRVIVPDRPLWLPAGVFLFCTGVEILQYFQYFSLPQRLGLYRIPWIKVLLGSSFDFRDILCYAAGCAAFAAAEYILRRRKKNA